MRRRQRGLQFYRKKKGLSMQAVKEVFSWIVLSVLAVFLAFMVIWAVGLRTNMIGVSMEPGLTNGQGILVNRLKYRFFSPQTGDVVVFLPNGNQNAHYYVKRVVAVPGQTVLMKIIAGWVEPDSGTVEIGQTVKMGYFSQENEEMDLIASAGIAENEIKLGKDEYFVLGDNCNNSEDSRSANVGPVLRSTIVGEAWFHFGNGTDGWGLIH